MASIGGVAVTTFNGRMPLPQKRSRRVGQWLADGDAIVIGGLEPGAGDISATIVVADAAAANTAANSLLALRATQGSVVDQWGTTWSGVYFSDIRVTKSQLAYGGYLVEVSVSLVTSSTPAGAP